MRRDVSFVFQDPGSSLNPRLPIGESIGEPLLLQKVAKGAELSKRVEDLLDRCTWRATCATATPTSCRAGSASASASPAPWRSGRKLLIADEPTSALDVSVQARVLDLFQELQRGDRLRLPVHLPRPRRRRDPRPAHRRDARRASSSRSARASRSSPTPRSRTRSRLLAAVPVPDPDEQQARRTERDALLAIGEDATSSVKLTRPVDVSPWSPEAAQPATVADGSDEDGRREPAKEP